MSSRSSFAAMPRTGRSRLGLGFVLGVQFLHGISYFAVFAVSQQIDTTCFQLSTTEILAINTYFNAVAYVTNLIGGWYADTKAGRYWTIFFANLINLIGTSLKVVVVVIYYNTKNKEDFPVAYMLPLYTASLMFMAVSRGFILPTIVPFGAQQLDQRDHLTFSSYFYWTILVYNIGKYIVLSPLAIIVHTYKLDPILTHTVVELLAEALAWGALVIGKRWYVIISTAEGKASMSEILRIISKNILHRKDNFSMDSIDTSLIPSPPDQHAIKQQRLKLRKMIMMFGIFATVGVFSTLYSQTTTTFTTQYYTLKGDSPPIALPAPFMVSFTPMTVIVLVSVVQIFMWCCCRTRIYRFLELKKIAVATFFAIISMVCAAYIEIIWRLHDQECSKFCQVPQFVFMGVADFLFFISGFEFSYRESFAGLQCTTTGFFYGVGSFFALFVFFIFIPLGITPVEMEGKLINADRYMQLFSSLAGLMLVTTLVILIPLIVWYTRVRKDLNDSLVLNTNTPDDECGILSVTEIPQVSEGRTSSEGAPTQDPVEEYEESDDSLPYDDRDLDRMSRFMEGKALIDEDADSLCELQSDQET